MKHSGGSGEDVPDERRAGKLPDMGDLCGTAQESKVEEVWSADQLDGRFGERLFVCADADADLSTEIHLDSGIRDLLDSLPFSVMLIDCHHRVLMANRALTTSVGVAPGVETGQCCFRLFHGAETPLAPCPVQRAIASGTAVEVEIHDANSDRWFLSAAYPTKYLTVEGSAVFVHMVRDVTEVKHTGLALERTLQEQSAMAGLLTLSISTLPMEDLLQQMLEKILGLSWLNIRATGAIFLVEPGKPGLLVMKAQSCLSGSLISQCASVPFGHCLCGRAAETREIVFADCVDSRHDVTYDGIQPHGHYCVPILSEGELLGVLNTYLEAGHRRDPNDEAFLKATTNVVAGLVRRRETEGALKTALERVQRNLDGATLAVAKALEVRDPYTAGHQRRVTSLACAIAREMHLSEDRIEVVRLASSLHDIGKIQVPSEILSKPTKLSIQEFELIKTHSAVGFEILREIDFAGPVAEIVHQHHEKINGSGYPRGLKEDAILLEAQILSVADVVEAVSSHRPYRPALGTEKALEIVSQGSGVEFAKLVVDACLRLFQKSGFSF
jgi:putative nucleotidyltransferase with HDIG domain